MAIDCTEFWKIEGNILNKTHHESPTEKIEEKSPIFVRRLSRRSIRAADLPEDSIRADIEKAINLEQRRNSYMPNDRIIVEESERSSSSPKSKPPTSETSSDDNSSYNIFGDENSSSESESPGRKLMTPNIEVKRFSNKRLMEDNQFEEISKGESSDTLSRAEESPKKKKPPIDSDDSSVSSSESSSDRAGAKTSTRLDPDILAKLDPRLLNPALLAGSQNLGNSRGSNLHNRK